MAEIDPELVDRAIRWCAEAGRQTTAALTRTALAPLSWDELLAVRALLADPPPARPLGPFALADIARGAPADVAAERERGGRYGAAAAEAAEAAPEPARPTPARSRKGAGRAPTPYRVRRASERQSAPLPPPRALPLFDELLLDEGRSVLEQLLRRHGGRRARILEALSAGWRRPDGGAIGSEDLDRALSHHGMATAFAIRERDELLHALRAAGGVRPRAASSLGLEPAALQAALERLGAAAEAERLREQRRRALRERGTLTQRSQLLLNDAETLTDLDLLEEFAQDLRQRLPDLVRALSGPSHDPMIDRLGSSLSLDRTGVERLAERIGTELAALTASAAGPRREERSPVAKRPGTSGPRARAIGRLAGNRAGTPNVRAPSGAPRGASGPGGSRPAAGGRSGGGRPVGAARPGGPKGRGGNRPGGGRPAAGGRSGGGRPVGARSGGPRGRGGERPPKRR